MKRVSEKLTKRLIDSLVFEGAHPHAKDIRWDAALPGFGVRVNPSGSKMFVIKYRPLDKQGTTADTRLETLGAYGPLTLEEARDLAKDKLGEVRKGKDPMEEKQKIIAAPTVKELCTIYMERHGKLKKSASEDTRRIDKRLLVSWGNRKARTITSADVARLHQEVAKSGTYEANRVLALVKVIWKLAKTWGLLEGVEGNPADGIKKFRERKRDRWVKPEEMPRLAAAIDLESNPYVRSALWLYLLTGARKSELLQLKWSDLDLERCEARLGDTKAGRIHYIPLSPEALVIIRSLPQLADNPHIFVGHKKGTHLVNVNKAWTRVKTAADIEDVRLHDLRRTVGSWLATSGASLPLIGKVLNHSNPSTTQIYARLSDDPARAALAEHGKRIMEAAKPLRAVK